MNTPAQPARAAARLFDALAALDQAVNMLLDDGIQITSAEAQDFAVAGPNVIDPPGTGADLLDNIVSALRAFADVDDAPVTCGGVFDTCPAGVAPAAVHVTPGSGRNYLLVAVPAPRGLDPDVWETIVP